jgi:nicotinate phosphoribosyltransferase
VSEFGARRAHGTAASVLGARAAYIAGCAGTSNALCDKLYGVPCSGTMAHSWVQSFPGEYEAFAAYARNYPNSCVLLIDTFNVLKSGLPNAIKCFDEVLKPMGARPVAVRIDSGDITYLSKKIRTVLDAAGYPDCKIMVSNSLDEYIIRDCINQGAKIDLFGVGERLITSRSESVFGGVYKIVAVEEEDGTITPKIKVSENIEKITTPCFKQVYRLFARDTGMAIADLITLHEEVIDDSKPYVLFDPVHTWKKKEINNYVAVPLLNKIFEKGKLVYNKPTTKEIREYCLAQMDLLWDEVKRFENPHEYYVDYSQKLWDIKNELLKNN